jgi:Arc/MetJ-type ribon-helix-helix transcriptional regulator
MSGSMICHTKPMVRKIAITLEEGTVAQIDRWVQEGKYPNRSRALQRAVDAMMEREKRTRFARELANLDPEEERVLAEERLGDEPWPSY